MSQTQENRITLSPWEDTVSFLPGNWREIAGELNVMKGARRDKSLDDTLHTLLIHLACGFSLKETVARASLGENRLYSSSHVALRDRLIKFGPFFQRMCMELFDEARVALPPNLPSLRLVDATDIRENGPTGSSWRFHFSFRLPHFCCDFTKLTEIHGAGTGENLTQFPFEDGDMVVADRGYSRATGIFHAAEHGAKVCIRLNYSMLRLYDENGKGLELIRKLRTLGKAGDAGEWDCFIRMEGAGHALKTLGGRICAIRKTPDQIELARKKLKREAQLHKRNVGKDTYFIHEYVLVFTTFPREQYPLAAILEIYRWRWQVELAFKRFKTILQIGHVPTTGDEATRAWLYGKMFAALLTERITRLGDGAFSPWGNLLFPADVLQLLETVRIYTPHIAERSYPEAGYSGNGAVLDEN